MAKDFLSRDDILGSGLPETVVVDVPEWGGKVRVKALTGLERDRYEESLVVGRGRKRRTSMVNARAKLVALTVVNEKGKPMFRREDIEALGNLSAAALERVFEAAMRLAGISDEDMEEMTANFTNGQSGDSTLG